MYLYVFVEDSYNNLHYERWAFANRKYKHLGHFFYIIKTPMGKHDMCALLRLLVLAINHHELVFSFQHNHYQNLFY